MGEETNASDGRMLQVAKRIVVSACDRRFIFATVLCIPLLTDSTTATMV
jgi:hypothetical protein